MNASPALDLAPLYVDGERLGRFVAALFNAAGLPPIDADTVAACLVRANLRGIDTHGVFRVPTYLKRLRAGEYRFTGDERFPA